MTKPYSEFTESDWAEHYAQKRRDLVELKMMFRIKPHWFTFKSLRIGPSGIFFNEGGPLFSFVWWRGKMIHFCLAIRRHVWELHRQDKWRFKHHAWEVMANEPT